MDIQIILRYLSALSENNDREWYHAHKDEYIEANAVFEELVQSLIIGIGRTDKSIVHNNPKDLTFKLMRNTNFSHDKTPYNPAFRAHIASKGKLPVPVGYFLKLQPGDKSFLGGGLFADMFKDATTMVRDYISGHPGELSDILQNKEFAETFTIKGTALKHIPKGYDGNHEYAEYLKYKSWYLEYQIPDSLLTDSDAFITHAVKLFSVMKPFNDFLNRALSGFTMPQR